MRKIPAKKTIETITETDLIVIIGIVLVLLGATRVSDGL